MGVSQSRKDNEENFDELVDRPVFTNASSILNKCNGVFGSAEASELYGAYQESLSVIGGDELGAYYGACVFNQDTVGKYEVQGGDDENEGEEGFALGGEVSVSSLRKYEASIAAKTKETVIKRIAQALRNVGIDVNPDDNLDKIIHDMKKNIPNPNNGKTFSSDADKQQKVCQAIATVLNDQFTPGASRNHEKLIDPTIGPVEVCRKVGEWVHSFSIGVNTEFLAVYASIQNCMRNILILDAIMEKLHQNIKQKIDEHPDIKLSADTRAFDQLYDRAKAESYRQKEILKNMLNITLPPAMKELELALSDETNQLSLIKRLNLKPGTTDFSDSIAYTLSAVGTNSLIAQKINEALKKVGIQVKEYIDSDNFKSFSKIINSKYKKVKPGELADFIKAVGYLYSNFTKKNDKELAKLLKAHSDTTPMDNIITGEAETEVSDTVSEASGASEDTASQTSETSEVGGCPYATGGESEMPLSKLSDILYGLTKRERKTEMELEVEKAEKDKLIIVRDFIKRITDHFEEFTKVLVALAKLFGDEIPITYSSDLLRDNIRKLAQTDVRQIELALIGYYSDATGREIKDSYINTLKMISNLADKVVNSGGSQHGIKVLNNFKETIAELLGTIDIYTDAISKKNNSTISIGASDDVSGGCPCVGARDVVGSGIPMKAISLDVNEIQPAILKGQDLLRIGINNFLYFYHSAHIKNTLKNTAKQTEELVGTNYIELLGDSVANQIDKLYKEKEEVMKILNEDVKQITGGNITGGFALSNITLQDIRNNIKESAKFNDDYLRGIALDFSNIIKFKKFIKYASDTFTGSIELEESKRQSKYTNYEVFWDAIIKDTYDPKTNKHTDKLANLFAGPEPSSEHGSASQGSVRGERRDMVDLESTFSSLDQDELLLIQDRAPEEDTQLAILNSPSQVGEYDKVALENLISNGEIRFEKEDAFWLLNHGISVPIIKQFSDIGHSINYYKFIILYYGIFGKYIFNQLSSVQVMKLLINYNFTKNQLLELNDIDCTFDDIMELSNRGFHTPDQVIQTLKNRYKQQGEQKVLLILNKQQGELTDSLILNEQKGRREITKLEFELNAEIKRAFLSSQNVDSNIAKNAPAYDFSTLPQKLTQRTHDYSKKLVDLAINYSKAHSDKRVKTIENNANLIYILCVLHSIPDTYTIKLLKTFITLLYTTMRGSNITSYEKAIATLYVFSNSGHFIKFIEYLKNSSVNTLVNLSINKLININNPNFIVSFAANFNNDIVTLIEHVEKYKKEKLNSSNKPRKGSHEIFGAGILQDDINDRIDEKGKKIVIDEIKANIEKDYEVKINLYKVVQAIDIYLKEFNSGISKDPKAINDIAKILDGTQVIANWFNEETGNNLCKAFECFDDKPTAYEDDAGKKVNKVIKFMDDKTVPDNHYYKAVNLAGNNDFNINRGVPFVYDKQSTPVFNHIKNGKKYLSKSIDNFQALKNLVNAFIRIGDEFSGVEIRRKVFMSPNQMYKYLIEYLKQSSFYHNYWHAEIGAQHMFIPYRMALNNIQYDNFKEENKFFAMIIKAMSAKILVTLGVYNTLHHAQPIVVPDPIRMVLGGADDSKPVVSAIPEAAELYFRLPRLAEFYRKLLIWNGDDTDTKKITMLPEIGGVFSGFIRLIFQKIFSPDTGNYSEYDVENVIREINYIYTTFKTKLGNDPEICRTAITEFIKEINKKIGMIKGKDMYKYWELQRKLSTPSNYPKNDDNEIDTNYSILPDEDDFDQSGLAPSDKYFYRSQKDEKKEPVITREIDRATNIALLKEFREKIEETFSLYKSSNTSFPGISYSNMIKTAEREMRGHSSRENRLAVAVKLIQTTKDLNIENEKAFMFHETVITGLNTLGTLYNIIMSFKNKIYNMDPIDIELMLIRVYLGTAPFDNKYNFALIVNDSSLSERMLRQLGENSVYGINILNLEQFVNPRNPPINVTNLDELAIRDDLINGTILRNITQTDRGTYKEILLRSRAIARYIVNYQLLMKLLIENIYGVTNNELISVKVITDSKLPLQFDFSNLVSAVEGLIDDIKFYINKFRPYMTKTIIDKYEKKQYKGSVNWFEENFVDILFKGKNVDQKAYETDTLNELTIKVNNVYNHLIRNTNVSLYGIDVDPVNDPFARLIARHIDDKDDPDYKNSMYESYGNLFTELIHYDNSSYTRDSNSFYDYSCGSIQIDGVDIKNIHPLYAVPLPVDGDPRNPQPTGIEKLLSESRVLLDNPDQIHYLGYNNKYVHRYTIWHKDIQDYKSLLFSFNQLLSLYLKSGADSNTNKIYSELIVPFANSVASSSVFSPEKNTFPDLTDGITGEYAFLNSDGELFIPIQFDANGIKQDYVRFGRRGDPTANKIICTSLAYIMQRMVNDMNPRNQTYDYLISNLTDVPMYMKEKYKNSLCYISKIMRMLVNRCDLIKDLMQKTKINLTRTSQLLLNRTNINTLITKRPELVRDPVTNNLVPFLPGDNVPIKALYPNSAPPALIDALQDLTGQLNTTQVKERLSEIVSSISEYTYSLISISDSVQRDLSPSSLYFETYNGFITNYKNRYNKYPLMPTSHMLYFIKDLPTIPSWKLNVRSLNYPNGPFNQLVPIPQCHFPQDNFFIPDKLSGTTDFKAQYGMRQIILNNKFSIDQYPGMNELIKKYNETSTSSNSIDIEHYSKFMQRVLNIVRFNLDVRNFKSYVQPFWYCEGDVNDSYCNNTPRNANYEPENGLFVYSYDREKTLSNLVFSIESTNHEEEIDKIVNVINNQKDKEDITRMTECINNIVDLNIVPINLNILMKEIPLINLYNYDYTFEIMVAKMYGLDHKDYNRNNTTTLSNIRNTQGAFLALLYHPYIPLDENANPLMSLIPTRKVKNQYDFISRIMRGDASLGLNRPKFLSDQLFNKVLFRSVYPRLNAENEFDESGVNKTMGLYLGERGYNNPRLRDDMIEIRRDLTYPLIKDGVFNIEALSFPNPGYLARLENVGAERFDTTIIRNLFFIVNVLRVTRLKLNRDLTSTRNVIVNSHYAVNPSITEYGNDPFTPNEIYTSKNMEGRARYEVMDDILP